MSSAAQVLDRPTHEDRPAKPEGPSRLRRLSPVLFGLLVVVDLAVPAVLAWKASLVVPTYHLDGAFQTASGLLRLSEGDLPGRDFFPYLGIGPVYVLYPVFLLLGGDLTASVFASHFVTLLTAQLVLAVLVLLVTGRRSRWVFALAAAVPLVVAAVAELWPGHADVEVVCGNCLSLVEYLTRPGNSLRPLRAFAPYLLTLVALIALSRVRRTRTRMIVLGGTAGAVAAIWSNDYGLVSGGLLVALITVLHFVQRGEGRIRDILVLWAAAAGGMLVAGFAATAGYFLPYLKYNLFDVRGDQFWYFGGWAESEKIFSATDLARVMYHERTALGLAVLAAVVVLAFRRRDTGLWLLAYLGTSTLLGGLAATIGGHTGYYFWAFRVWAAVVAVIGAGYLLRRVAARFRWPAPGVRAGARRLAVPVTALALVSVSVFAVTGAMQERSELAASEDFTFVPQLDGYLDVGYAQHLELAADLEEPAVEEYMGLLGSLTGPRQDLAVDSVIHALGDQRAAFAERMADRPDLVVTTAPEASDLWATWNMSANWWFYRELFRSYLPETTSPMTLAWTPTEPAEWEPVDCSVHGYGVRIDAPTGGLYEVELTYRGPGQNARAFSMVRNNINAPPGADGYLALDPAATSQAFPVYVHDTGPGRTWLPLKDVPTDSGRRLTSISGCSAAAIQFPDGAQTMPIFRGMLLGSGALPYRATPMNMTFGPWDRGVHVEKAAFVVSNTDRNRKELRRAELVRFAGGDTRMIEQLTVSDMWITVHLSGDVLDPDAAAYPRPFWLNN